MKIAFINGGYESIGIQYMSSLLKKHGHQTRLFVEPQLFNDMDVSNRFLSRVFDFKEQLVKDITEYEPDIIGFSVVSDFYQWACQIAGMLKQKVDTPVIFGGVHPTAVPERVIMNDFVDMVCVGEGEYPLLEVVKSLEQGELDYSIKNIWFKCNGRIIKNEVRPLIQELDLLPFPDKDLYNQASPHFLTAYYTIMGSRGCPFSCSFCYNSFYRKLYEGKGEYVRWRSVDNVITELSISKKKYKFVFIEFYDDVFAYDVKWLREFSVKYKKEINMPFSCLVHPDIITEEMAGYLKVAGCYEVEIGVQSFSEETREKVLNRFVPNSKITKAFKIFNGLGIKVSTDNILGIPGQNKNEVIELAKFYNENRVFHYYYLWLRYYPKIEIIQRALEQKALTDNDVDRLENGCNVSPFTRGGSTYSKETARLQVLLTFLPYLSKRFVNFLLNRKLYRFLPVVPLLMLKIIIILLNRETTDYITRKQKIKRYICFIKKSLAEKRCWT